ncbi:hypothetical protein Tco_1445047 [Tanacetum coccineum]
MYIPAYARLVDTESEPEEAPSEAEELQSLGSRVPLMGEEFEAVEPSGTRTDSSHSSASSDSTTPLSPDHPLTHISPTPTPTRASFHQAIALSDSAYGKRYRSSYTPSSSSLAFPVWKRYQGTSKLILDTDSEDDELGEEDTDEDGEDESLDTDDEREGLDEEDRSLDDEGHSLDEEGLGLEGSEEDAVPKGQQRAALVVETALGEPLGLGYGALRRRELAIEEDQVYSMFEVGQGSGSVLEPERPERVSALRQPTLTTWIDLEDGRAYIDVPAYPPPIPPVQTPPSPEWSSGSLPVSPAPSTVPSPISSPMIPLTVPSPVASPATAEAEGFLTELGAQVKMQGGLIHDHTVGLGELSPALFKRSLEHEQERVAVTFGAIWRPVLALKSWAGQKNAQRAALWHAVGDTQMENWELRLQIAKERRARLDLAKIVASLRRGQEPRGDV